MSKRLTMILFPIWILIGFNLVIISFNYIGVSVDLRGHFVDWYLGFGFMKIAVVWAGCIAWSLINFVGTRKSPYA